jgi:membrane associated rhomboid family serine protease
MAKGCCHEPTNLPNQMSTPDKPVGPFLPQNKIVGVVMLLSGALLVFGIFLFPKVRTEFASGAFLKVIVCGALGLILIIFGVALCRATEPDTSQAAKRHGHGLNPVKNIAWIAYTLILSGVFIGQMTVGLTASISWGSLSYDTLAVGEYYRLFTYSLLHLSFTHFFANLIMVSLASLVALRSNALLVWFMAAVSGLLGSSTGTTALISEPIVGASGAVGGIVGLLIVQSLKASLPLLERVTSLLLSVCFALPSLYLGQINTTGHLFAVVFGILVTAAWSALTK